MPITFDMQDLADRELRALLRGGEELALPVAASPLLDVLDQAQVRAYLTAFEHHVRAHTDAAVAETVQSRVRSVLGLDEAPSEFSIAEFEAGQARAYTDALLDKLDDMAERHELEAEWHDEPMRIPARCGCRVFADGEVAESCRTHRPGYTRGHVDTASMNTRELIRFATAAAIRAGY